jgi:hypothetical protein
MNRTLLFALLFSLFACKNESTSNSINFIKTFEGEIANKYEVVMKLRAENGNVEGNYFYRKTGEKIKIKGTIEKSGKIMLNEYDNEGKRTGVFVGRIIDNTKITGTWNKPNGKNEAEFTLIESNGNFDNLSEDILNKKKEQIRKEYTKNDLIGNWFVPHFAVSTIKFNPNNTFVYDDGSENVYHGTYEIINEMVNLFLKAS